MFLIYINDLNDGLNSTCKIFPHEDINTRKIDINNELVKISTWTCQWKLSFNPGIYKQAAEIYFYQRPEKSLSPPIIFNSKNVLSSLCQKHLSLVLDSKLRFSQNIAQETNK